jgi:hypothetical protein
MTERAPLKFFDLVAKKEFESKEYEIHEKETRKGRIVIAKAKSPYTGKVFGRIVTVKKLGK